MQNSPISNNAAINANANTPITAIYDPNSCGGLTLPNPHLNTQGVVTDWNYWSPYYNDSPSRETYEFKLVDGTKVIQDLYYSDIVELREVELCPPNGKARKIVRLTLNNRRCGTKTLEIDCNLSMFMKIIGHKYKPWSKSLMEESVKNGSETN